ncbi:hypothetical protein SDRG_00639 [Saprolegnia diclina VS20]|uniref:Peptidase C1A papain C-terminal domain-containing protein n=1 Tax=Saprolegnia diclina (strain VS20) TaxID=1156394 RepID=T0R474_SAPDV|nr:hypothetical protein SDRG_00639 [Saprolegnia diclina VS20]EQC41776.1 hypothetical protein SDRG_00639 [Saprolegnia diclina VS20]|eukprot:XP_008604345.1 hypothetical protein SDRG_00639 [Saprolegnia diclina VS20]
MALRAIWSSLLLAALFTASADGRRVKALRARFAHWRHSPAGQIALQRGFLESNHTLERYFNARLRARALRRANPHATFGLTPYALLTPDEFQHWVDPNRTFHLNDSSIVDRGFASTNWTIVAGTTPDEWHIDIVRDDPVVAPPTLPADTSNASTPVEWAVDHTRCYVTPPRFQGRCGNCWAFASNAAIEGAYCAKFNTTISLSDQFVTTCSDSRGGCNGGTTVAGINFARSGACALADAPFTLGKTGTGGACQPCAKPLELGVAGVGRVAKSVAAFQRTLATTPIAVSLSAGNPAWQFYVGGVLTSGHNASAPLDHAVTIVGYGVANGGVPVWKIRNSWGTKWGEGGYMLLDASTNGTANGLFHVLSQGFVPLM